MFRVESGAELVIDARAAALGGQGLIVDSIRILADISESIGESEDRLDEFETLKRAAEGGFIEVLKRIVGLFLFGFLAELMSVGLSYTYSS